MFLKTSSKEKNRKIKCFENLKNKPENLKQIFENKK